MRFPVLLFMLSVFFIPAAVVAGNRPSMGVDILPAPKMMEMTGKRFVLNDNRKPAAVIVIDGDDQKAVLAAQEINDRIKALGGDSLSTVTAADSTMGLSAGMHVIRLEVPEDGRSGDIPDEVRDAMNIVTSKGEQGYAIRFCRGREKGETVFLAGSGWQGLLYASSTFRLMIKKEGSTIFAIEAQVTDWPDFKYRGLPVWPLPGSLDDFKKYVDWAFRYKFNRIYTYTTRQKAPDGFNLPNPGERRYLRKINTYARDRGIKINYELTWAVAQRYQRGNRDEHRGSVLFNEQYYSWSDDESLRKRASEIAQFAHETEAESLLFHCIDTYEEGWDKRGENDRSRFGNDRASADANVINIFTREIRKTNPGIELQFVVSPYHANFDLPGNERYKTWITRLTGLIPRDIYLTVAEFNREQTDSWVAVARQPLVHWINGYAFQWGRYFSTLPAFSKTAFYEGRDQDIIIQWEPIGYFNGEVMQLIAAEYSWNVDAPGSGLVTEERTGRIMISEADLHYRKEIINGIDANTWAWYNGTGEPKPTSGDLLLKACRLEFGETAAPFVADFLKNNTIGWRSPGLFSEILRDNMSGTEWEACSDQLTKTKNALASLKKALETDIDSGVRVRLNVLLRNTYHQSLAITGAAVYYEAMKLSAQGLTSEAAQALKRGRDQLAETQEEMERRRIWSQETVGWFEEGSRRLKIAEAGLEKASSKNRINNPGFEEPTRSNEPIPGWASIGSVALTDDSHSGEHAAHLSLRPSDRFVLLEQPFTVPAGCEGLVEFWMKKEGDFRVIPILQYWNEGHTKKIEKEAADDFPFSRPVKDYTRYIGILHLPPHVTQTVFKIYADWFGFTPVQEKALSLDDVFVGCGPIK